MFGDRLKKARQSKEISQASLAKLLSVSQQTVGSWEINRTSPSPEIIAKIADLLECSTDYLLGNTDNPMSLDLKSPVYDDEALELMEEMHKRPELKTLFKTSRKVKKEDIEFVDQMIKRMAGYDNED